jgi:RNA polymerase sigma factor (sigma-70 family)
MDHINMPHPDNQVLDQLKISAEPLDDIFRRHKDYCLRFMQKMQLCDDDTINDIYTDAVIVLYEKAKKPEFFLTCSIQTYLNSVCRNQILVRYNHRKSIPIEELDTNDYDSQIGDWYQDENPIEDRRGMALKEALLEFKNAKGNCYEILYRYFYLKQKMDQIAYEMDYTNADNVKNQKHRCQKRLKESMIMRLNK